MENKSYEDFRSCGKKMVDFVCDYIKDLDQRDVNPINALGENPGFLPPLLSKEAPSKPEAFEAILNDISEKIMMGTSHWNHLGFHAYYGSGNAYPSVLAEMLSSALGVIGFSWSSCPSLTELETIMLDWYAKAMGLPDFFLSKNSNPNSVGGGSIQGSASDAIYAAMFSAQKRAARALMGDSNANEAECWPKLVAYASNEAHSCCEKAGIMNLVNFRNIQPDFNDQMTAEALETQIKKDIEAGLTPFFVVATLGTTGQAAFDHLEDIGKMCQKYPSIWLHGDGAYGGNLFLLPEMRIKGMEYLDSFEVNPNKSMCTSFDCTCLFVKNIDTFTKAFVVDPIYLKHENENKIVDLRHFGTPLSRRFRALKLYFMFRMYGLKKLKSFIRRIIAMGKCFEELVKSDDRFELMNQVVFGVVCFRLRASEDVMREFIARCNASGKIFVIAAKARKTYICRFVCNQENCNEEQVRRAFGIIQEAADDTLRARGLSSQPLRRNAGIPIVENPSPFKEEFLERYSMTRILSKEALEKEGRRQKLVDGWSMIYLEKQ